jgi:phage terminase small subunit
MTNKPKPPTDLSAAAKKLWRTVYDSGDFDPPAMVLLDSLARSWDRVQQARALILKDGIVLVEKTAHGDEKSRANPACAIERDASASMMRAWRLLGFDQAPPEVD